MKNMKTFLKTIALTMVLCLMLCGIASAEDVLRIGLAVPVTGTSAAGGEIVRNGVQMAIDEINANGGIDGKWKIELITEDNQNDPSTSVNCMEKLCNQDKVDVVISATSSSCCLADMAVTREAGVAELAPASTAASLTEQGNEWFFRTAVTDGSNVVCLLDYFTQKMNGKKICMLYESNDFGNGGYQLLADALPNYEGVEIIDAQAYNVGDVDFSVQLTQFKNEAPDAIFIWGHYEEVSIMAKQMAQYEVDIPVMGTGYNSPYLTEMGGEYVEGIMLSTCYTTADPAENIQKFDATYHERFNASYDQNAPQSYDTIYMIADAVTRAQSTDRAAIRQALTEMKDFPGLTGVMNFDEKNNVSKTCKMIKIQGGQQVLCD
jgi:branched-chain amino acid transport system substrate-binding protein